MKFSVVISVVEETMINIFLGKLPYCSEGCDGADMEGRQHAALQQDMGRYKVNYKCSILALKLLHFHVIFIIRSF